MPLLTMVKHLLSKDYRITIVSNDRAFKHAIKEIPSIRNSPGSGSDVQFVTVGAMHELFTIKKRDTGTISDTMDIIASGSETILFKGLIPLFDRIYGPSAERFRFTLSSLCDDDLPDLFVVDSYTFGALDVAKERNVPVIVNSITLPFSLQVPNTGIPSWGTGYGMDMTMHQRMVNIIHPILLSL
eukprot:g840.t1